MNAFSLLPARYVGFNSLFNQAAEYLDAAKTYKSSYPAYDIVQTDTGYEIEIALAGFTKEELKVTLDKSNGTLRVSGKQEPKGEVSKVYSTIASRQFTRVFTIEHSLEVENVTFINGMLKIILVKKETDKNLIEFSIKS